MDEVTKFHFMIAGIPLSPLHNAISIGQEICLRGHNVTVFSFSDRGRKKVEKYSARCKLNYVDLGPLPVSEEKEEQVVLEGMSTNSTRKQLTNVMNNLMLPYNDGLAAAVEAYFKSSNPKFDYALLTLPFGRIGQMLRERKIDFAVNIPTIVVPPLVPWAAPYVPIPFYRVSVHNMTFLDRVAVLGGNTLMNFFRAYAVSAGFKFSLVPEMGNSATESMALGVPLVGYPQFGDQPAVCQRIADVGAGISGPPGGWVQSDDVLHVLHTERYAERAAAMSRLLEKFGGVSRAVDLLELAVHGDLKLLETPLERTASSQFFLRGYDLMIYMNILVFMFACCCLRCCGRRQTPVVPTKEKKQ